MILDTKKVQENFSGILNEGWIKYKIIISGFSNESLHWNHIINQKLKLIKKTS